MLGGAGVGVGCEPVGERAGSGVGADAGEGGGGLGEERGFAAAVLLVEPEFVLVVDACAPAAGDAREEEELVVVACGSAVSDVEACDDEEDAGAFEVGVGDAGLSEEFGASHLEPGGVGAVVCEAHGVALGVADAEAELALGGDGVCWVGVVGGGHGGMVAGGVGGA